jgi:4-amino-4-deoxy-L-arabinose transferase-like glycosyltransferase
MTASASGVIGFARAASTDMPLAATFSVAMLAWYAWYESEQKVYLAFFYVFLGLGTLAKGPVAPFLALIIILLFALAKRDFSVVSKSVWLVGIMLYCVTALPWYVTVQLRNPEFFRVFILQHNLERISTNRYHHPQPFWYYLPILAAGLIPWIVYVVAAGAENIQAWWAEKREMLKSEDAFSIFLLIWLLVPLIFFSTSQSKLPGYILPALPAGTLLLAEYLRRHANEGNRVSAPLIFLHAIISPLVPALIVQYTLLQIGVPFNRAALISGGFGLVLAVGIALTLRLDSGLRSLRFVTLVPVILTVAAVLRLAAPVLDANLSARPLATEIARMENGALPAAVFRVPRETEYGLQFYRNQPITRYEVGGVPTDAHLLVAPEGAGTRLAKRFPDRRFSYLGSYPPQKLDFYWVSTPGMSMEHMSH